MAEYSGATGGGRVAREFRVSAEDGLSLYCASAGDGPVILIIQGGPNEAGATTQLVEHLAVQFTVVTYDRRGLSRSSPSAPGTSRVLNVMLGTP